jgi:KDO2-lipid IV(A) lauroyltransferase
MTHILSTSDKIKLFPFWLLTLVPLSVLYIFSDFLFIIAYYLVRYRRKVVSTNLRNSFPEKSTDELLRIEKRFSRYLADYFIESIYVINMSIKECQRRYRIANPEVIETLNRQGRDVIIGAGHYGNWEWATCSTAVMSYKCMGIYRPLRNKLFDRLFIYIRSKYNSYPVPIKESLRTLVQTRKENQRFGLYLIGDQRPIREDLDFWIIFLKQETPVITGIDRLSRKFDTPVFYLNVERVKRGYYSVRFDLITEKPNEEIKLAIAEKFMRKVEQSILREPAYWFWSHKRWRYNPEEFKPGHSHS